MTFRKVAESDVADSYPFEADHVETHQRAHPADLAFSALSQHESQLIIIEPLHQRWSQLHLIEFEAMTQALQTVASQTSGDSYQILFVNRAGVTDDVVGEAPVLSEQQQPLTLDVEAARHTEPP